MLCPPTRPNRRRQGGFTLLELMIVVIIVLILATVAIVSFIRYIKSSRLVGAKTFMASIQAAQETYFQRFGQYHNTGGGTPYPGTVPKGGQELQWNPAIGSGWRELGVAPENNVTYFQWDVRASTPTAHALSGAAAALGVVQVTAGTLNPWYYIRAEADLAGNGGVNTVIFATSQRSEPATANEGE